MSWWIVLPLLVGGSWALTALVRQVAIKRGLMVDPNHRSSHTVPTATGGGVGFVVAYLAFCSIYIFLSEPMGGPELMTMFAGSAVVAVIGYIDDHRHISAKYRLLLHLAAVLGLLLAMPVLPEIVTPIGVVDTLMILIPVYTLGLVWLLNLYNFMDGIDGIASVETVTTALGVAALCVLNGYAQWGWLLAALAASVTGFGMINWPPAKIFMGDVGSGFLGYTLGALALLTAANGSVPLWCWVILLAVFVVDASVTLVRRALRGQRVYEAHRSHAYQILSRRLTSHQKVTLLVGGINVFWLFPLAWLANEHPVWGGAFAVVAYVPLVIWVYRAEAGTAND